MKWRLIFSVLILLLPSPIKIFLFRIVFGYRVARKVRIGLSVIAVERCEIGEGTRIGHGNIVFACRDLRIGADVVVGHFNLLIGGDCIDIGDGAMIARFNEINSILEPVSFGPSDPSLFIGAGTVITASHKIDFTDRVEFGKNVVFAGRNSNIWTHNRQEVRPVSIGAGCYIGAGVQFAPGSGVGEECIVGLGSVLTRKFSERGVLLSGHPATVVRSLDDRNLALIRFPTRPDLVFGAGRPFEGKS